MSEGPLAPTTVVGGATSSGSGTGKKEMLAKPCESKDCTELKPTPM